MAVPVYYRVLGLDPGAADQDIREAFHRLAALYQPDGTLENALAARRLRLISEAYSVLGDPVRRAAYDAQLTGLRSRSSAPLTTPEASTGLSTLLEEPAFAPGSVAASPVARVPRPTLLGRLRRRPFRSMGVVVAVTFVLLGAWVRPQRPSTDLPLGSPPSIVVPTAATPLVAAIGKTSRSAVASPSPRHGSRSVAGKASPMATKARPSATRRPASHSTPPSTATPVPTQSVTHHSAPSAAPPRAKGSGTPASSPTPSRKPTTPRTQGGSNRAHPTTEHIIAGTLAMAYAYHPNSPITRSVRCAAPQQWSVMLPFQVGRRPDIITPPRQADLQARPIRPSFSWSGRPTRLPMRPSLAWMHSPAQAAARIWAFPTAVPKPGRASSRHSVYPGNLNKVP